MCVQEGFRWLTECVFFIKNIFFLESVQLLNIYTVPAFEYIHSVLVSDISAVTLSR